MAWDLMRLQVAATSGQEVDAFPDYAGSEEEMDTDEIERQLSLNPLVHRVAE
jgi:hypothetical protein